MTRALTTAPESALTRLDWESHHFGISAAQLNGANLSDEEAAQELYLARQNGVQLVVWPAESDRAVPRELLEKFGGTLVDRKVTYRRHLNSDCFDKPPLPQQVPAVPLCAANATTPALISLAIIAGEYSRFRVDPRISRERFEAMYQTWIERSVGGELADIVFIVRSSDCHADCSHEPIGLISLEEKDGSASIGLVAVAPAMQGRGIGSALMQFAHRWMIERGASESRVVTQQANAPACRLYERFGYRPSTLRYYYHFWL